MTYSIIDTETGSKLGTPMWLLSEVFKNAILLAAINKKVYKIEDEYGRCYGEVR